MKTLMFFYRIIVIVVLGTIATVYLCNMDFAQREHSKTAISDVVFKDFSGLNTGDSSLICENNRTNMTQQELTKFADNMRAMAKYRQIR